MPSAPARSAWEASGAHLPTHTASPPQARPEKSKRGTELNKNKSSETVPLKIAEPTPENTALSSRLDVSPLPCATHPTAILASGWQHLSFCFTAATEKERLVSVTGCVTWPSHLPFLRGWDSSKGPSALQFRDALGSCRAFTKFLPDSQLPRGRHHIFHQNSIPRSHSEFFEMY